MEVKTAKQTNKLTWQHHLDNTEGFKPLIEACWDAINTARNGGVFHTTIGPNEFEFSDAFKEADPNGAKGCALIMLAKSYFRSKYLDFKVLKLSANKFPIEIQW